jgi:hypothetical protein
MIFGGWFFGGPTLFFGLSEEPMAWNNWLVGVTIVLIGIARMVWPRGTTFLGLINIVLGLWIFVSPFVLGFTSDVPRLANSIVTGGVVFAFSFVARLHSKRLQAPRSLSSDNDAY